MKRFRIYCNYCKSETLHEYVCEHKHERYDSLFGETQVYESYIVKCNGCEEITFKLVKHPFEFVKNDEDQEEYLFPDRVYNKRDKIIIFNLPKHISTLYDETIIAHDNNLTLLSTIGLRSLLESVIKDKIDSSKYSDNIVSKINSLKPYFSENVIDTLHEFRKLGNKAAHDNIVPENLNIHHALYVIESILEYYYSVEEHAEIFNEHIKKKK